MAGIKSKIRESGEEKTQKRLQQEAEADYKRRVAIAEVEARKAETEKLAKLREEGKIILPTDDGYSVYDVPAWVDEYGVRTEFEKDVREGTNLQSTVSGLKSKGYLAKETKEGIAVLPKQDTPTFFKEQGVEEEYQQDIAEYFYEGDTKADKTQMALREKGLYFSPGKEPLSLNYTPLPHSIREKLPEYGVTQVWDSKQGKFVDIVEPQSGTIHPNFGSMDPSEIKYYEGASDFFESLTPEAKEVLITKEVTTHPKKYQGMTVPWYALSAGPGFWKEPGELAQLPDVRGRAWENIVFTPQEQYKKMDPVTRVVGTGFMSFTKGVESVFRFPEFLLEDVIAPLATGKTPIVNTVDIIPKSWGILSREYSAEKYPYSAPGLIEGAPSAITGNVPSEWKDYKLESTVATLGEIGGLIFGGKAFSAATKPAYNILKKGYYKVKGIDVVGEVKSRVYSPVSEEFYGGTRTGVVTYSDDALERVAEYGRYTEYKLKGKEWVAPEKITNIKYGSKTSTTEIFRPAQTQIRQSGFLDISISANNRGIFFSQRSFYSDSQLFNLDDIGKSFKTTEYTRISRGFGGFKKVYKSTTIEKTIGKDLTSYADVPYRSYANPLKPAQSLKEWKAPWVYKSDIASSSLVQVQRSVPKLTRGFSKAGKGYLSGGKNIYVASSSALKYIPILSPLPLAAQGTKTSRGMMSFQKSIIGPASGSDYLSTNISGQRFGQVQATELKSVQSYKLTTQTAGTVTPVTTVPVSISAKVKSYKGILSAPKKKKKGASFDYSHLLTPKGARKRFHPVEMLEVRF